jgi:2-haloacid dehalogenase
MKDYELVFLDADETIFDFSRAESYALEETFRQYGLDATQDSLSAYHEINKELWERLEKGEMDQPRLKSERFRLLLIKLGIGLDAERVGKSYIEWLSQGAFLLDGAEEICEYLSRKYKIVIITNGIKEVQSARIGNSRVRKYFSKVVISEEANCSKPSKEIFEYACRAVDYHRKDRMIIVGDSLSSDIQGGLNFGIDTCWANLASKPNQTDMVPTYEIRTLEELKTLL